jgi:nicotinamidase-related amidase
MSLSPATPRRALVVIDVQNEYFSNEGLPIEYPSVAETLPNITRAMDAASAAGIPVIVVQHTAPAGSPVFDKGSARWQLHPEIARRPRDLLIEKSEASVFSKPDFAAWLSAQGIDTISIVGYMTHNCNASTIFAASQFGFNAELLADASGSLPYANAAGTASAEEIHRVFSVVIHTGFAAVASTADWLTAVAAGKTLPHDDVLSSNQRARA